MNLVERVLTSMQRKRRSVRLKQRQPKIQAQRERRKRHTANKATLERRARKLARSMIRDRVAGKGKGKQYGKMNVSQKIVVDHMIDKYQDRINKLAKMLLPVVRRGEMTRMQHVHKSKGNTKLTGGVGRLNASYEREGQIISEEINDYRLERLLLAGLENKNDVQIFKRLLGNSVSYARMEVYRRKLLKLLNHILELVTNDYQLYTRAEMVIRKNKLEEEMAESRIDVIKKVVSEALTTRTSYSSGTGGYRRSKIKTKGFRPTYQQRVPRGAKPVGRGGVKRVTKRPAGANKVGAPAAYKSADRARGQAMSRAKQLVNRARQSMRRTMKQSNKNLSPAGFRR